MKGLRQAAENGAMVQVDAVGWLDALRALWAVRVLDAQLAALREDSDFGWEVSRVLTGAGVYHYVEFCDGTRSAVDGPWDGTGGDSPDAARLAAAEAVFPTLPADERAKLGEMP